MKRAYRSVRWMAILSCAALYNTACSSKSEGQSAKATGTARQAVSGTAAMASSAVSVPTSTPASSGAVPGRIIVKYKSDGNHAVTECAERWMVEGRSFRDATADRSNSLDDLHKGLGVRGAHALMPGRRGLATNDAKSRLASKTALRAQRSGWKSGPKARTLANLVNLYVLDVPELSDVTEVARRVAADPHVEYAQPDYLLKADAIPNDPFFSTTGSWGQAEDDLWGIKKIGSPAAWDVTQGEGVVVAVVDTGLDMTHPDIAANVWQNPDEIPGNGLDDDNNGFIDDVNGWNFAENKADPTDDVGHGTHVSGTIAAVGNNAVGVIGIAPRAKIQPIKAFSPSGGNTSDLARAMTYAVQNGAKVINNSWSCGFPCPENHAIEDVVDLAHDAGVTVVFAAGNSNVDIKGYSPQNQPNVIVVSASDPADQRTYFSNYGFVDVAAPGGGGTTPPPNYDPVRNILSLKSAICLSCPAELTVGDLYLRQAGTSMAAPHVVGAAALVIGAHPTYSPEQVRQALRRTAADTGAAGFDLDSGYGRINVAAAVAEPTPLATLISTPLAMVAGATVDVTGTVAGPGFASYVLDYGLGDTPSTFTTIASSTTQANASKLGTWNLGGVPDGVLTLRVRATTTDGRTYEDRQRVTLDQVIITEPSYTYGHSETVDAYGNELLNIRGTVSPTGFQNYQISVLTQDGAPVSGANIALTNGGTARVVDGVLAVWNTAGMPGGGYQIVLTANTASGGPITETVPVVVDTTFHSGWPIDFSPLPIWENMLGITDHVTLADVNADGKAEVIVGYNTEVAVYDHTGVQLAGWPQNVDPLSRGSKTEKSPVVADINGDGVVEVIGANNGGLIMVWRNNGQLLYKTQLTNVPCTASYCTPSLAADDVDRDGVIDIIATNSNGDLAVLRSKDKMVPFYRQSLGNRELSAPAIGDVNGDGKLEIVVAASDPASVSPRATDLYVYGLTGLLTGWPKRINDGLTAYDQSNPVLGDVDRNGKLDIVMTSHTGVVNVLNASGTQLSGWPRATRAVFAHTPALGDFNRDGRLDVLVGTSADYANSSESDFFALKHDGTVMPGWPAKVLSPSGNYFGFGAAALADIDGDGMVEAIAAGDSPTIAPFKSLRAFRADGTLVAGYPKTTVYNGASSACTAAVADVDGDGLLEMAWLDLTGKLYLWDLTAPATAERPWPMFQHDARHTGRADPAPQFRATFENRDSSPTNNQIQPRLRIVNNSGSSVPLSQLTVRYWYTNETKPNTQLFQVYFAQNESNWASIPATAITSKFTTVARPLADTYMQMGFTSTAGTLTSGSAAAVEFNIHAQNWGNYQETNDYSYSPSTARIDWTRVTVYRNGVLVWGTEP